MSKRRQTVLQRRVTVLREIVRDVRAFDRRCQSEEFTDTGDAWDLLYTIRDRAKAVLPKKRKA